MHRMNIAATLRRWALAGLASSTLVTVACESVDSEDIKTSGLHATFSATADGTNTDLEAILRVGGSTSTTFVDLSDGDTLNVAHGDQTITLQEQNLGDYYYYIGGVPTASEGERFVLSFDRDDGDSAPESVAELPAPMDITTPNPATGFFPRHRCGDRDLGSGRQHR